MTRRTMRALVASILAITLAALAGCSSGSSKGSSKGSTSATTAGGTAAAGLKDFNVCVGPQADYAPVYVGQDLGIFQKHGLNVIPHICPTSPVAIASILKGDNQLANNSLTGLATAIGQGIPAEVVVPTTLQPTTGNTYLLVKKTSTIQKFVDMQSKTLGTITVQGLFQLGLEAAIDEAGGNPNGMKVVGAAPADLGALLDTGKVDAVMIQDPTASQILAKYPNEFRDVGNAFGSVSWGKGVVIGILSASSTELKDAALYQKFRDAWPEAVQATKDNRAAFEKAIMKYTGVDAATATATPLPQYTTTVDQTSVTAMVNAMLKYGFIKTVPTFDEIYWNGK